MKLDSPDARRVPRPRSTARRAYDVLVSPKLAIVVLVAVLGCCIVGVTVYRGETAWRLIFSTLWFNGLLVLLAVSSAAAFFTRIWKRKLTLVSVGMILFHVSFAALLGGVVFNGLFHFKGLLRLTEGETLPTDRGESYDQLEYGRWFDFRRLRGEATLIRMHTQYTVDGQDKRAAYEIEVGDGARKKRGIIYITRELDDEGIRYLCAKEGYSVLLLLVDRDGRERYGAHIPLQSIKHPQGGTLYATGTATEPGAFPFPPPPEETRANLVLTYRPSTVKEREGEVGVRAVPLGPGVPAIERTGEVSVGGTLDMGTFGLLPKEIRYWVGMDVRYDPGLSVILASLCSGLGGMVLIFIGRIRQGSRRVPGPSAASPAGAAVSAPEEVA